ncbi:maleylpyruvate isomerase family mycothiol-dependent enzyme [Kineococcus sp. SYSU DK018]|uniref:maleylpyruvate isomerase family mycothiol-dependent enzyme n=1 Tax=Kineococcus sp. SYSU DK018 TaxID=3383139 RepID=UPI003D7E07D9
MDLMREAEEERAELLALLTDLDDQEWETPSLCRGWTVRDVVAHLLGYEGLSTGQVIGRMLRGRLALSRINAVVLAEHQQATPHALVEKLRQFPRPTGLTASRSGGVGMVDALIHQQDIRRPLQRPRSIDPDRVRAALSFSLYAPPLRGAWRARGVRVIATDVDWAYGRGPEARGLGEAVLMAIAGRPEAAHELSGEGSELLQRRLR